MRKSFRSGTSYQVSQTDKRVRSHIRRGKQGRQDLCLNVTNWDCGALARTRVDAVVVRFMCLCVLDDVCKMLSLICFDRYPRRRIRSVCPGTCALARTSASPRTNHRLALALAPWIVHVALVRPSDSCDEVNRKINDVSIQRRGVLGLQPPARYRGHERLPPGDLVHPAAISTDHSEGAPERGQKGVDVVCRRDCGP